MPALANSRHEIFAHELAKGASQMAAFRTAGYKPIEANACRLANNDKVVIRVHELKAAAAERTICTIHDIADQLDEDRRFARELENASAAISATMGKAKVLGHLSEKVDLTGSVTITSITRKIIDGNAA